MAGDVDRALAVGDDSMSRSPSRFWMRPMAISLPGICRLENSTTSPAPSAIWWLPRESAKAPRAARPAAGRDDQTSPRGKSIALSKSTGSGKMSR
jgi:hypothetical protein